MKRLLALVICFMFVGVGSIFAQSETDALLKKHTFEMGTEIFFMEYKEPGVMKNQGMMYGLVGSYTYHNKIMLKAEARGNWGRVDYSNSGEIDNISDYMLEFRGLGGYDFSVYKSFIITPFIGIGYRYLNDDSSGKISTTGALGYERESNYLYSPIGIGCIIDLGKDWSLGGTGEYDLFWWGREKSHLSDAILGFNDVENHQEIAKGYGLRGSITLGKKYRKVIFEGGPFVRYWNIKKSEDATVTYYGTPVGYGWVPKNNTTEFGAMLGARF